MCSSIKIKYSLCERNELLIIAPASYKEMDNLIDLKRNKVFMKAGKSISEIKDLLKEKNAESFAVECCGMENEKIYKNLDDFGDNASYFSIIIVKDSYS